MATIDEVHRFWFGDGTAEDPPALVTKLKRWFMGGPALDGTIRDRFGDAVEKALAGELDGWAVTPRGRVALVILLDQLPRSIFRGGARAFEGAPRAERLALEAFDALDADITEAERYTFEERLFLATALLHAESEALLVRCLREAERNVELAPEWSRSMLADGVEQANKYLDVVRRFGRFPHRNAALGRTSTQEEEAFLVDWSERAPPKGARAMLVADAARG